VILNLEWASSASRDRELVTPVINYLRFMGAEIFSGSIFEGFYLINKLKPQYLLISNVGGSSLNYSIVLYAKSIGIRVVSLISEGYLPKYDKNSVFGPQFKLIYKILVDLLLVWNQATMDFLNNESISIFDSAFVTGNTGIDRFTFSSISIKNKEKYNEFNLNRYDKIISVALWDWEHSYNKVLKKFTDLRLEYDLRLFNQILFQCIKENPDCLFILRQHPGSNNSFFSGILGLGDFTNTLIIKNELNLIDNIDLSSVWLSYDSTTSIEAYLRGKRVASISPSPRSRMNRIVPAEFQPQLSTSGELSDFIRNSFEKNDAYTKGNDSSIAEILKSFSSHWDGLNHVRAGNRILDYIDDFNQALTYTFKLDKITRQLAMKAFVYRALNPIIPDSIKNKSFFLSRLNEWDDLVLYNLENERLIDQLKFYSTLNLNKLDLRKIY
jgi:hypothetical protein